MGASGVKLEILDCKRLRRVKSSEQEVAPKWLWVAELKGTPGVVGISVEGYQLHGHVNILMRVNF